jgi:hypothetical protein
MEWPVKEEFISPAILTELKIDLEFPETSRSDGQKQGII